MSYKDSRDLKHLEEFELVDGLAGRTYTIKDVYIEPTIGKNGMLEYKVYDSENNHIGTVDSSKNLKLDANYKERKSIEIDGKTFDFDSKELEADINEMIQRQEILNRQNELERERRNSTKDKADIEEKESIKETEDIEQKEKMEEKQYQPIEDEELEEQGYNISSYTAIKDQKIIDSMLSNGLDPRSIIVAEVDGQFKFLGREYGTGEIKELAELSGGNSYAEEVNKFNGNVQYEDGRGTTMIMPDFGNMEFNIEKNSFGQIEVGYIKDLDGDGTREVIPVQTDVIHPTIQEYRRAEYEKYGYEFEDLDSETILTENEIDERLKDEEQSIQNAVKEDLEGIAQNPTKEELEEKIENEKEEQEIDEPEQEREEDEEEWVLWRPRAH